MKKSLFYRFFGLGKIPKPLRRTLEAERIEVSDEGIGGWIVYKNFKAPGKRFYRRMKGFAGFLVVTRKRVIAYAFRSRMMNIPLDDPKLEAVSITLPNPERIEFSFESSVFHPDRSGEVTLRFNTSQAETFYDILMKYRTSGSRMSPNRG